MLQHAFKEWAVVCEALARGQQALILRKGGIAEHAGQFAVEHTQFWLYPTYVHQQSAGIQEEFLPLLQEVEANRPPAGTVRVQYWAQVATTYRIRDELAALLLSHLHCWSEDTVSQRFSYRAPGLNVLLVRVHRVPKPHEIAETPEYAGCRSWVELKEPLSKESSTPVLSDEDFRIVEKQVNLLLSPTALA